MEVKKELKRHFCGVFEEEQTYNVYCEKQNVREDGRVEWVCGHGCGHTIDAPKKYKRKLGKYWSVHGCDGCCGQKPIKSGIV